MTVYKHILFLILNIRFLFSFLFNDYLKSCTRKEETVIIFNMTVIKVENNKKRKKRKEKYL